MSRPIVEVGLEGLVKLREIPIEEPVRFVFLTPRRGGPALSLIRATLAPKGKLRLSGTTARIFADMEPGEPEPPLIALETVVRSDAAGLERMVLSALPHVDEIVLGVDGRSDEETIAVAHAYADQAYVFQAQDIGIDDAAWSADRIHFANARNLGRGRVQAPWTLVVDADEYVARASDLRNVIRRNPDAEHVECQVTASGVTASGERQRLARTALRWTSATHNQLVPNTGVTVPSDLQIAEDKTLRTREENARRDAQRDAGIEELVEEAGKGNIIALLHLAKHRAGVGNIAEAVKLVEDYRLRIEPHSILAHHRVLAALSLAFRFYYEDNGEQAEVWALRALLDGPCVAAFCLLGDLAEERGDLTDAKGWYECACAITEKSDIDFTGVTALRWARLDGIRTALSDPANATQVVFVQEGPEAPTEPPSPPSDETRDGAPPQGS